jgi:nucleoside-triphosphatase
VSKYGVDLAAFERLALPAITDAATEEVVLIDELGKMELASEAFCSAVVDLFEGSATIIATVQIARHPFTDVLKKRSDVETIRLTSANRVALPEQLASRFD